MTTTERPVVTVRGVERGERRVDQPTLRDEAARVASAYTPGLWRVFFSADPVTGAVTKALFTPPGFSVPEKSHFCDADHEIFLFEGEFDFDDLMPMRKGDYLYRPAGTVYGDGEHSTNGGIQIISFGREKVSFHLDDPPRPWPGHYLVDAVWNPRPQRPMYVRAGDRQWEPCPLGPGTRMKRLRGIPGVPSATEGPSSHSPWAADAACVLAFPAGDLRLAWWPATMVEFLVLEGMAEAGGREFQRGDYFIGTPDAAWRVVTPLELYARTFSLDG